MSIIRSSLIICLYSASALAEAQPVEDFKLIADEISRTNVDSLSAMETTISMELCEGRPGFKAATAATYDIWKRDHQAVLRLVPQILASSNGSAPIDEITLSKKCVRLKRYFTHSHPDPLFATPEKTWERFLEALRTGDREAASDCLTEPALSNLSDIIEGQSIELLRKLGTGYEPLKPSATSGDRVTRTVSRNGHVGQVFFVRIDHEWRIEEGP